MRAQARSRALSPTCAMPSSYHPRMLRFATYPGFALTALLVLACSDSQDGGTSRPSLSDTGPGTTGAGGSSDSAGSGDTSSSSGFGGAAGSGGFGGALGSGGFGGAGGSGG